MIINITVWCVCTGRKSFYSSTDEKPWFQYDLFFVCFVGLMSDGEHTPLFNRYDFSEAEGGAF